MNINKKKLSLTFKKIKGEIDEVKKSLNSFTITNDSKIKTINQKFNLSLDETIILFKKRLDLSINEINDSLQEIYDTTSKSKVIDKKIAQIQHKLDKHSLNIKEFTKIINDLREEFSDILRNYEFCLMREDIWHFGEKDIFEEV